MRLLYNQPLSTHPNPSLKKGGAPLRRKFRAHSPSLFQGGGQGVGTITRFYTPRFQLIRPEADFRHAGGLFTLLLVLHVSSRFISHRILLLQTPVPLKSELLPLS